MRIGVNCYQLSEDIGGLKQYFLQLFGELLRSDRQNSYVFFYFPHNLQVLSRLDQYNWQSKAIELNARYAEAYYNRGLVYHNLGQPSKAISDYTKAIKVNPKFAQAYGNRGSIYAFLGKSEDAKEDLLKAVKLNPASKPAVKKISDRFKLNLRLD